MLCTGKGKGQRGLVVEIGYMYGNIKIMGTIKPVGGHPTGL